jgi:hypothetical protein
MPSEPLNYSTETKRHSVGRTLLGIGLICTFAAFGFFGLVWLEYRDGTQPELFGWVGIFGALLFGPVAWVVLAVLYQIQWQKRWRR